MRTIVTTMRNEAPFILEWLAYHRLIGFTDFLVFSNDCADGTDAMLDRLADMGLLTHLHNPRPGKKTVQWKALSRAGNHPLVKRAEWVFVSDVDEFLCIHPGAGYLDDLFAACPQATGFALPWRMFGNAGVVPFRDAPVIGQFVHCGPDALIWPWRAVQFKSLFRPTPALGRLGVHSPQNALRHDTVSGWVDGNGQPMDANAGTVQTTTTPRYGLAQINHYALGAVENFLIKAERGRPNRSDDPIDLTYWTERNLCTAEDRRILRHAEAVTQQIDDWLCDPQLAALHQQGVAWRHKRIAEIRATHDGFRLFAALTSAGQTHIMPMPHQIALLRELIALNHRLAAGPDRAQPPTP